MQQGDDVNIDRLIVELQISKRQGWGNKEIYMDGNFGSYNIDSVQKNTHPSKEPEYMILMAGMKVDD